MTKYMAFSPDAEILGQAMLSFMSSININDIAPYMARNGLIEIDPGTWYPMQNYLNVLSDMSEAPNAMFNFVSIGMKIMEQANLPPGIEKLPYEEVVLQHNKIYQMQARGTDPGDYKVEKVANKHIKVTARVPFPDDFVYGSLYGEARRFLPKGNFFSVSYDETTPRRDQGGETTVLAIKFD